MFYIWTSPSTVSTVNTNGIFGLFPIPFCTSIKSPFKLYWSTWISKYIARYSNHFASGDSVHILLVFSTKRFIWNDKKWIYSFILKYFIHIFCVLGLKVVSAFFNLYLHLIVNVTLLLLPLPSELNAVQV